jgi:hypothetical protein
MEQKRGGAHRGCHERRIIGGAFFVIFKDQGAVCLVRPILLICQQLPIAEDNCKGHLSPLECRIEA